MKPVEVPEMVIEDAPPGALPPVLTDPPWLVEARRPKPKKLREPEPRLVPGLEPPAGRAVAWKPGEREKWGGIAPYGAFDMPWEQAVERYMDDPWEYPPTQADLLATGRS